MTTTLRLLETLWGFSRECLTLCAIFCKPMPHITNTKFSPTQPTPKANFFKVLSRFAPRGAKWLFPSFICNYSLIVTPYFSQASSDISFTMISICLPSARLFLNQTRQPPILLCTSHPIIDESTNARILVHAWGLLYHPIHLMCSSL